MTTEDTAPLLLRATQVAELLNLSLRSLWTYVGQGRVPAPIHIGRSTRWKRSDIDAWLAQEKASPILPDVVLEAGIACDS